MEARIGKSYLTGIPHEKRMLTFQYPPFRGSYGDVVEAVDRDNLEIPSSAETSSLIYDAFQNQGGRYESEIIQILDDDPLCNLWEFTGNRYLPKSNEDVNNGVIIVHKPKMINQRIIMDKQSLVKRLQENDPLVKFVPFEYKIGEQSLDELKKNPYILARYGEEGAEKITEVASRYRVNPSLMAFNFTHEERVRMSALGGSGKDVAVRLIINGNVEWQDVRKRYAFGLS